ncbi:transposase [Streptomyces sp. NPDC052701]|uniref:transposase n=1 Tax=Streptomyces sp. NPDC052701 TaxID=3155533 RepID=UPI0034298291
MIDAIAYEFHTGTQWVRLPEEHGTWRGVHDRLRMWAVDGTWERVSAALVARADADEDLSRAVPVDRNDRAGSPARGRGPQKRAPTPTPFPEEPRSARARVTVSTAGRPARPAPDSPPGRPSAAARRRPPRGRAPRERAGGRITARGAPPRCRRRRRCRRPGRRSRRCGACRR